MDVLARLDSPSHYADPKCVCTECIGDRLENKCKNPHKCTVAAGTRMGQILPKWDAQRPDTLANEMRALPEGEVRFMPPPEISTLLEGYRIFTKCHTPAAIAPMAPLAPPAAGAELINVAISGHVEHGGSAEARSGAGAWFSAEDPRNASIRIPDSLSQTLANAEVIATLHCVQSVPTDTPLRISVQGDMMTTMLNKNLGKWEDRGWIGVPDRDPTQALATCLRKRTAATILVKVADSAPHKLASQLAQDGAANDVHGIINLSVTQGPHLRGAKLASLTQALAYKGIKELRTTPVRKSTASNIKLIQDSAKIQWGKTPTVENIWKSVRHKDISRQIRTFLWKAIHGAHRVGKFWEHIPGYEDRALCHFCGETESLEHILFQCQAPGQYEVWKLAGELWKMKFDTMPAHRWGESWDAALHHSSRRRSRSHPGCEHVIGRDGESHSDAEIHNRWVHTLNKRLEIDQSMACDYHQDKKLVLPSLVLQTWSRTLLSEERLPKDWLREPKVLVGIVPKRSQRSLSPVAGG
ncbi:hypothetical protein B0H19DRAFT_1340608 [Mycena capillaripes]|nr:hypothetical protein B0H19DRAFT_1340608 [Mycena capillaripes]